MSAKERSLLATSTLNHEFFDAGRRFWIEEDNPAVEGIVFAMETEKNFWAISFHTWEELKIFLDGAVFVTL